ncbi:hypothetical protein, partial [Geobacter sp. AOG1]|uniref:hypothetical protein n=1 Tax=Geobacter sp. AOG1 TaxID=1566346 RepID=UPI001CC62517
MQILPIRRRILVKIKMPGPCVKKSVFLALCTLLTLAFMLGSKVALGSSGQSVCDPSTGNGSWYYSGTTYANCDNNQGCAGHWAYDTADKVYYACTGVSDGIYLTCESINGSTKIITTYGYTVVAGTYFGAYHDHRNAPGQIASECSCPEGYTPYPDYGKFLIAASNTTYEYRCQCNLTVNSFTGDKTSFNPGAGQTLNFSMAFTETYNNPVTWT